MAERNFGSLPGPRSGDLAGAVTTHDRRPAAAPNVPVVLPSPDHKGKGIIRTVAGPVIAVGTAASVLTGADVALTGKTPIDQLQGLFPQGKQTQQSQGIEQSPKASITQSPDGSWKVTLPPSNEPPSSDPTQKATPEATATQVATPEATLSPEQILQRNIENWLNGTTPTPDLFYKSNADKKPAPLGIINPLPDLNSNSIATVQAAFIGEIIKDDANGNPYQEEILGFEDAKKGRIIVVSSSGSLDSTYDCVVLNNHGIVATQPNPTAKEKRLKVRDMQQELEKYNGQAVLVNLIHIGNPTGNDALTKSVVAQNKFVEELLTFLGQIEEKPYSQVPISGLLKANLSFDGDLGKVLKSKTYPSSAATIPFIVYFTPQY